MNTLAPSTKMVFVLHSAAITGPLLSLIPAMREAATRSRVLAVAPSEGHGLALVPSTVSIRVLKYERIMVPRGLGGTLLFFTRQARAFLMFLRLFRETRPQTVVVATATVPVATAAARLLRIPVLVYAGELLRGGRGQDPIRAGAGRFLTWMTARASNAVVCCSGRVALQYVAHSKRSVVLHPPLSGGLGSGDGVGFRRSYGIPLDARCVTQVGALTYRRGQDILVNALPRLMEVDPRVHCMLVGEPHDLPDVEYARSLADKAVALGVGDRLHMTGAVLVIADALAATDVVVNAARLDEGYGRVAFEALAAGRPVVAARVGAIGDLLEDQKEVLLFSPENSDELVAHVSRLLTSAEFCGRITASGRVRAMRELDEQTYATRFLELVDLVTNDGTERNGG